MHNVVLAEYLINPYNRENFVKANKINQLF